MARKRLNLTPDERRLYNNKMHRKQEKARKEKRTKEAYKTIISEVAKAVEEVGWDKINLLLGPDEEMLDKVADYLMKQDTFKIVFGRQVGVKLKNNK